MRAHSLVQVIQENIDLEQFQVEDWEEEEDFEDEATEEELVRV
jgi:hypothetical protein